MELRQHFLKQAEMNISVNHFIKLAIEQFKLPFDCRTVTVSLKAFATRMSIGTAVSARLCCMQIKFTLFWLLSMSSWLYSGCKIACLQQSTSSSAIRVHCYTLTVPCTSPTTRTSTGTVAGYQLSRMLGKLPKFSQIKLEKSDCRISGWHQSMPSQVMPRALGHAPLTQLKCLACH